MQTKFSTFSYIPELPNQLLDMSDYLSNIDAPTRVNEYLKHRVAPGDIISNAMGQIGSRAKYEYMNAADALKYNSDYLRDLPGRAIDKMGDIYDSAKQGIKSFDMGGDRAYRKAYGDAINSVKGTVGDIVSNRIGIKHTAAQQAIRDIPQHLSSYTNRDIREAARDAMRFPRTLSAPGSDIPVSIPDIPAPSNARSIHFPGSPYNQKYGPDYISQPLSTGSSYLREGLGNIAAGAGISGAGIKRAMSTLKTRASAKEAAKAEDLLDPATVGKQRQFNRLYKELVDFTLR